MDNSIQTEKESILVRMNFPAPPITDEEVQKILNNELVEFDYWIDWLEKFFGLPKSSFTKELLNRFQEINNQETFMNVVPAVDKLLKPLEDSCKAYSFGLYSASIALSGVAAESLQILLWEMQEVKIQDREITLAQEKAMLGKEFKRVEQSRRIEILHSFKWIDFQQKQLFEDIRNIRNKYTHSWDQNFEKEKEEALYCYKSIFKLFRDITGVKLKDASSVESNPLLTRWMNKKNI